MSLIPASWRPALGRIKERLLRLSLQAALREQGLAADAARLAEAVPDISAQYSGFSVAGPYLELKVRGQHAFQVALARSALTGSSAKVVDLGDSAGTHIAYLQKLVPGGHRFHSINLDAAAVSRIQARGLEAIQARAEDLAAQGIDADVLLCFETLEHLSDPVSFLHDLATKTSCRRLVLTVPYVEVSRVGLHHVRAGLVKKVGAESVHLFELCPEDLRLVFKHSGWRVVSDRVYRQYPRFSWLRLLKSEWRRTDFEGFYGAVLERDDTWSRLYEDWR